MSGVVIRIQFLLPSLAINHLAKIPLLVEQTYTDYRNPEVAGGFELVACDIAEATGLHQSTVSRAVADKYVQLPNRKVIPFSAFFEPSRSVKDVLQEIVEREGAPLADAELAEELSRRGYNVARRTVAKYRKRMGILPSTMR